MVSEPKRLNFGCGPRQPPGWCNVDIQDLGQEYVNDVLEGLPFPDEYFDYVVANHSICGIKHLKVEQALNELRRVTKHRGVLRVLVPDIQKAFVKWHNGEDTYFPNDNGSLDERFCGYLTWFSSNASVFTQGYLKEVLERAGWKPAQEVGYRTSHHPNCPGIVELDTRREESIIVEAVNSQAAACR